MDWESFLKDSNINFVTYGPNVKKGNINIHCPFCGQDDPSEHMGISLTGKGWSCWRNRYQHIGKKPYRLIQAILGCSYNQAKLIEQQYSVADPETFDDVVSMLSSHDKADKRPSGKRLTVPPEFRDIRNRGSTKRFWDYLLSRGFTDIYKLVSHYDLMCCLNGTWKERIIFPIYINNKLVSWTARAIVNPFNAPRYLALSEDEGALINIKHTVYEETELKGGDVLFITEGPFDALKIDYYGYEYGANGTCTFSTYISIEQIGIIAELSLLYKRTILLFDPEASDSVIHAMDDLERFGVEIGNIIPGVEDPGALTPTQVKHLVKQYIR